jgi:hypothetical protein
MPVPAVSKGKPWACASVTTDRIDNPKKLGALGPLGTRGAGGAGGGCGPNTGLAAGIVGTCASASSRMGGSTGPSMIGASFKSAI